MAVVNNGKTRKIENCVKKDLNLFKRLIYENVNVNVNVILCAKPNENDHNGIKIAFTLHFYSIEYWQYSRY